MVYFGLLRLIWCCAFPNVLKGERNSWITLTEDWLLTAVLHILEMRKQKLTTHHSLFTKNKQDYWSDIIEYAK